MRIGEVADALTNICQDKGECGARALAEVRQPLDRLIHVQHNIGELILLRREEIDPDVMLERDRVMFNFTSRNTQRLVLVGHGEPARGTNMTGDQRLVAGLQRCGSGNPDIGLAMRHKFGFILAIKRLLPHHHNDMATRAAGTIAAGILHMVALHLHYDATDGKVQRRIEFMRTFNDDASMQSPIVGTREDVLLALCA